MIEVKAYQCTYCGKKRFSKSGMKAHEQNCFFNETKKACVSCSYFKSSYDSRTCLKQQDLSGKLKNGCRLWASIDEHATDCYHKIL